MPAPDAELSSITTALQELTKRITALAEANAGDEDDPLAQGLFEVEDKSVALAASVGVSTFAQAWTDATAVLNAAERACAQARSSPPAMATFNRKETGNARSPFVKLQNLGVGKCPTPSSSR